MHMEYYSAVNTDEVLPFITIWKELEVTMLSDTGQAQKDKHFMISS